MSDFIATLLNMSLIGTYCILVVLLLRLFLRKAPRVFTYVLWGVVFLRLALPIFPEAPVSLIPEAVRSNPVTSYFSAGENDGFAPSVINDNTAVSPDMPEDNAVKTTPVNSSSSSENTSATPVVPTVSMETDSTVVTPKLELGQVTFLIWGAGFVLLTSYNLITYLLLRRRLTDAVMEDGVFITDKISSPFVIGMIRPRIYLPVGLTPEERALIVLHEHAHLRRRDPVIKLLAFLITSFHWFNPFTWIAFLFFSRDIEMTCDESVVRELGDCERKKYSATLLSVASGLSILRPMPLAFGDGNLKGRIKNVLNYRKPGLWLISLAVVCVVVISVGLLMNPVRAENISNIIEEVTGAATETEVSSSTSDSQIETIESAAPETSMTSESTTVPSETTAVIESTTVPSETYEYEYEESDQLSPAERTEYLYSWSAKTPVDPNAFETAFAKYNFTISKIEAVSPVDVIYQAISPDGRSVVTCSVFSNTELSYQAFDSYMKVEEQCFFPEDNYLYMIDSDYLSDEPLHCAYLNGNVMLEVSIPIETDEMSAYFHALHEFGMGRSGLNINGPMPDMPDTASLCTTDEFQNVLFAEALPVNNYGTQEDYSYRTIYDEFKVMVTLKAINIDRDFVISYLSQAIDGYEDTLAIRETDSYRCLVTTSTTYGEYHIHFEQDGRTLFIDVKWDPANPEEQASQRALAERLLQKLCFSNMSIL